MTEKCNFLPTMSLMKFGARQAQLWSLNGVERRASDLLSVGGHFGTSESWGKKGKGST